MKHFVQDSLFRVIEFHLQQRVLPRSPRFPDQFQTGLGRRPITLPPVAFQAAARVMPGHLARPELRGTTWSKLSWLRGNSTAQYWQLF